MIYNNLVRILIRTYLPIVILSTLLIGCNIKSSPILSPQKMEEVLFDIYITQGVVQRAGYKTMEAKDSLVMGVLAKNGITQAQLDTTLAWYAQHSDKYTKITDKVSKRIKALYDDLNRSYQKVEQYKKKIDPLNLPPILYPSNIPNNTLVLNIDSTKIGQIDTANFVLRFKTLGISHQTPFQSVVVFTYPDTTLMQQLLVVDNREHLLKKNFSVSTKELQQIDIYFKPLLQTKEVANVALYEISYSDSSYSSN